MLRKYNIREETSKFTNEARVVERGLRRLRRLRSGED